MQQKVTRPTEGEPVLRRHENLGPLHDLLLEACPPDENGNKSIYILSRHLKGERGADHISAWAIYKWIKNGKLYPDRAMEVVDISEGRVSLTDLFPFVFMP